MTKRGSYELQKAAAGNGQLHPQHIMSGYTVGFVYQEFTRVLIVKGEKMIAGRIQHIWQQAETLDIPSELLTIYKLCEIFNHYSSEYIDFPPYFEHVIDPNKYNTTKALYNL